MPNPDSRHEQPITVDQFLAVELRVGRVLEARLNPKARKPAFLMTVDFGDALGTKTTSAQVTENYSVEDLVGRLVVAVVNFPPKRVAGVESEVLLLAAVDEGEGTVLLRPDRAVPPGTRIL